MTGVSLHIEKLLIELQYNYLAQMIHKTALTDSHVWLFGGSD